MLTGLNIASVAVAVVAITVAVVANQVTTLTVSALDMSVNFKRPFRLL